MAAKKSTTTEGNTRGPRPNVGRRVPLEIIEYTSQDEWTVDELQRYLHQINILYNRLYVIDKLLVGSNMPIPLMLTSSLSLVPKESRLSLNHIEFHSPGGFSFQGLGEILGQFRGLWKDVTYANRIDRKEKEHDLENKKKLDEIKLRLANTKLIERNVNLLEQAGVPPEDIKKCVQQLLNPVTKIVEFEMKQEIELLEVGEDKDET